MQEGDTLRIETTGFYEYTFSMEDGEVVERRFLWSSLRGYACVGLLAVLLLVALWAILRAVRRRTSGSGPVRSSSRI